jgi:LysM repeat protein
VKKLQLLFIFILAVGIFGSSGYFAYELFIKPGLAEQREKAVEAAAPAPTATPDPGIPEFQRLKTLQSAGKIAETRDGLNAWITKNPQSSLLPEARQMLGTDNMALLFQPGGTNVASYTVVKGDSLARIASRQKSNAELIQRANDLPGINLQIGQQLVIPSLKISLEIDRAAKTLTLLNDGAFLKEYTLLSAPSAPEKSETLNSKVLDKVCIVKNKRVAFGDKSYPNSERSILLVQSPGIFAPAPETNPPAAAPSKSSGTNAPSPPAAPSPAPLPGGYVLPASDLIEIFPLVSRNTPVIIH